MREVAPHAGAWIETQPRRHILRRRVSPPTRGRGLKPVKLVKLSLQIVGRPPRGGVD